MGSIPIRSSAFCPVLFTHALFKIVVFFWRYVTRVLTRIVPLVAIMLTLCTMSLGRECKGRRWKYDAITAGVEEMPTAGYLWGAP